LGKDFFPTSLLRLGVQEEDNSGSVGDVSCCWAKVGRCVRRGNTSPGHVNEEENQAGAVG
jgi:hypothetical protein